MNQCNRRSHARRRPCTATSAPLYPARACTPRHRKTPRSEVHAAATVHLRLMTRVRGLGWCHASCAYSLAGEPPCAIGRRFCRMSPPPPRPSPSSCRSRSYRATASAFPRAYKTLPAPFPRSPEQLCHPPPPILLLPSHLLLTSDPKLLPSTHSSFHVHGMA
jgi:hypothetical protein